MKKILLSIAICLSAYANTFAQECEKTQIKDALIKQLLRGYIHECIQNNYFYEDKGVVEMLTYPDSTEATEKKIMISAYIDDRYKENPPQKFAHFEAKIILIYEVDTKGRRKPNLLPKPLLDSLEVEIGDRVYIRPTLKTRWAEHYLPNGKTVREKVRTISGGNPYNTYIIYIDKKTGAVRKLKSV